MDPVDRPVNRAFGGARGRLWHCAAPRTAAVVSPRVATRPVGTLAPLRYRNVSRTWTWPAVSLTGNRTRLRLCADRRGARRDRRRVPGDRQAPGTPAMAIARMRPRVSGRAACT